MKTHLEQQAVRFLRIFAVTLTPSLIALVIANRTSPGAILGAGGVAVVAGAFETSWRQAFRVTPLEQQVLAGLEAEVAPALAALARKQTPAAKTATP